MSLPDGLRSGGVRFVEVGYNRSLRYFPEFSLCTVPKLTARLTGVRDPFHVYALDPNTIGYVSGPPRLYGLTYGGEWDLECPPIESIGAVRGIEAYFFDEDPDPLFEVYEAHISQHGTAWGHTTVDSFDERLREIESLYDSINERGYRSQRELARDPDLAASNNEPVPIELNEVTVNLDRNGNPLYAGFGAHRLAIARILELDEIPVIVASRHRAYGTDTPFASYDAE